MPKNKGFVSGILLTGGGAGSFFFSMIITFIVNPDNKSPEIEGDDDKKYFDSDVADNVPKAIRVFAILYWIVSTIGVLMLIKKKTETN